ncbi:MAG: AAA family ATPase, partial [Patescibacteria group bacterium]
MTQDQALQILKTGANVFLTGEPGSGKTHAINLFVSYLRERGIEPAITASTGIAATHIGGMTIHSWSGIGIKSRISNYELDEISSNEYIVKRVQRAKILIIDEVSMLLPETLTSIDAICRAVRRSSESFGGLQVIFVGDFFQLPPVMRSDGEENAQTTIIKEAPARFAYDSPAWARAKLMVCYLTEQHRQDDDNFLAVLSAIRRGVFGDEHLRRIELRKIGCHGAPEQAPKLFSHNIDVDRVNDEMLAKLPDESRKFIMSSRGRDKIVGALKKSCLSPETLSLKIGAAVMFTKNNPKEGFANGTLGVIFGFNEDSRYPIVKTRNGRQIEVAPMDWTVEDNGMVRGQITQLPLRLAWAITVHK